MGYNGPLPQVVNAGGTGDATLTAHNLLVGEGTSAVAFVSPSATSGVPVVSQGAASDPHFGTAVVAGGGTGQVTLTNHGVLIGAGTSAITQSSVGATGTILAGNTGADPTFQSIGTVGGITTITGNSGGAESPSAGNFNILGTGSITIAGSANTETVQLTGLTAHNVLLGEGTATVGLVAPSATSGVPLISQGASSDPVFGTAVVSGGGTGDTSFTAYSVITGGTTSTGALQNVSGVGTSGQVLTSNGAGALPTWQTAGSVGSLVLIQTQVASSSAALNFTSGISSTYQNYMLIFDDAIGSTVGTNFIVQLSSNGGSSYITSGYTSGFNQVAYNSTTYSNENSTAGFIIADSGPGNVSAAGNLMISGLTNASFPMITGQTIEQSGCLINSVGGSYNTATAMNALRVMCTSGNISTGTFSLYGIAK